MSWGPCCSGIATQEEEEEEESRSKPKEKVEDGVIVVSSSTDLWLQLPEELKVDILCRLSVNDLIGYKVGIKSCPEIGTCRVQRLELSISSACVRRFSPPSPSATFCGFLLFGNPSSYEAPKDARVLVPSPSLNMKDLPLLAIGEYFDQLVNIGVDEHVTNTLDLLPPEHRAATDIRDCCNGLLLLASSRLIPTQYYDCNPVTKQRVAIPVNPNHHHSTDSVPCSIRSSLVFDPSRDDYGCNYMIVHCIHRSAAMELEWDVFRSETGKWTSHVIPVQPPQNHNNLIHWSSLVFERIRRTLHWNGFLCYLSLAGYLVCIDINILLSAADPPRGGACWAVELPDTQQEEGEDTEKTEQKEVQDFRCIGICSGSFYYSNRHCQQKPTILVWMLVVGKSSTSKWVLRHRINTDEINGRVKLISDVRESFWPCAFHLYDDQIIYMAAPEPRRILSYDLRTKHARVVGFPWWLKWMIFDQNLIFPDSRCLVALTQL